MCTLFSFHFNVACSSFYCCTLWTVSSHAMVHSQLTVDAWMIQSDAHYFHFWLHYENRQIKGWCAFSLWHFIFIVPLQSRQRYLAQFVRHPYRLATHRHTHTQSHHAAPPSLFLEIEWRNAKEIKAADFSCLTKTLSHYLFACNFVKFSLIDCKMRTKLLSLIRWFSIKICFAYAIHVWRFRILSIFAPQIQPQNSFLVHNFMCSHSK